MYHLDSHDCSDRHDKAVRHRREVVGRVRDARVVRHRREAEDGPDRVRARADELRGPVVNVDLEIVDEKYAGQDLNRLEIFVA